MHKITITWPVGLPPEGIAALDAASEALEPGMNARKTRSFNEDGILTIERFFTRREDADAYCVTLAQYSPGSFAITAVE